MTRFLNIDLDLRSKSNLKELLEAFGSTVIILNHEEEGCASIEIATDKHPVSIDEAILDYYNIINSLPTKARTIWNKCDVRSMNIGVQAGTNPYSKNFTLSKHTISLLSSINAEVVISIYADKKCE